ncbi:MAG TPA: hypothetical protein VKV26_21980 [Dehalococcoidia bacterium]|nr:hypothetical protein [Dehalococcoidia bacterium]
MCDDQPEASASLAGSRCRRHPISSATRPRPAPTLRRRRGADGQPLIVITQRDDVVLVHPLEARRLAQTLLRLARQ